ncbi:uncharacterized protein LAESUDRAFT_734088 [Laetiporus sulphureus 93-53]|uniref:DUF6699 domain-containing protein n=1 Tax=Laetiporus sulphureus 93-53 TaxID=1314785 RepID=A0A165H254_9APHY|nr:uncharacterized protein LAESUDRAFT_734088 [Laetiporus sulphureus 93-53]KZT11139.1 hypothetical protein LAESUDRAFT_734088 [Laetiporus sulphureus 93-53]
MTGTPGSYFMPPVALPPQQSPSVASVGSNGFPPDWTGFPTTSPYAQNGMPPASHPQTPFVAPGAPYAAFQPQPPAGYPVYPGMWPIPMIPQMGGFTPYPMHGGWAQTPFPVGAGGLPPQAGPAQAQVPQPTGGAPPPPPIRPQDASEFDKFAEGPHYGPVLSPLMVKKVKARLQLNPLLMPPPEEEGRDYIKWNMLFSTAQCQRSSDPAYRSWSDGRNAPATWPRVSSLRLISRHIPWPIEISVDEAVGVTCGDVIEGIHTYMNGRVLQRQFDSASADHKRVISDAFYHNRSTAQGVPGGRLPQTLLRFDWLGQDTMFGGITINEQFVQEVCGGPLPCVFELLCRRRYPMSEQEILEQEERERQADARTRRRGRSRATSRATSTTRTSSQNGSQTDSGDGAE